MKRGILETRKFEYHRLLELGLIFSLIFHVVLFQSYKRIEYRKPLLKWKDLGIIKVVDIPITELKMNKPTVSLPQIPIPRDEEEIPDDATIDPTILILHEPVPPPPLDETWQIPFKAVSEPPFPIGGYELLQQNLVYPEIARKAGVEGLVVIAAHISELGHVIETRIMKTLGPNGCDEAAIKAIRSVKWRPAFQRDEPVDVWISVPFHFKLKDG